MLTSYLNKRALFPSLIKTPPKSDLQLIITIPAFNEVDLLPTLLSLSQCEILPLYSVEVIVLFNAGEQHAAEIKNQNEITYSETKKLIESYDHPRLTFHILLMNDLPKKKAGVGLARKIIMDEAVRRFEHIGRPNGIISCLDADTHVNPNYCVALFEHFNAHKNATAVGIYYEHDLTDQYSEAITLYELHLRYYVHALRQAGLITSTQTVGSSMAVRASAYVAQGGMNTRQAGEDFYFLHKFTPHPGFHELTTTTTIPSARISDRVPFGTGKAIGDYLESGQLYSYSPAIFNELKLFLDLKYTFYNASIEKIHDLLSLTLNPDCISFLIAQKLINNIGRIKNNTNSRRNFKAHFFQWFSPFMAMKFVHHLRDKAHPNIPVVEAARIWLKQYSNYDLPAQIVNYNAHELLTFFRKIDRDM